jgi:hypothetical protein
MSSFSSIRRIWLRAASALASGVKPLRADIAGPPVLALDGQRIAVLLNDEIDTPVGIRAAATFDRVAFPGIDGFHQHLELEPVQGPKLVLPVVGRGTDIRPASGQRPFGGLWEAGAGFSVFRDQWKRVDLVGSRARREWPQPAFVAEEKDHPQDDDGQTEQAEGSIEDEQSDGVHPLRKSSRAARQSGQDDQSPDRLGQL